VFDLSFNLLNPKEMRILLLGEYSNLHNTLAKGLRLLGHSVTVASNGDFWKNYPRDIDLARKPSKLGGVALLLKTLSLLPRLRGYDVVQLINPIFIELKAEKLFPIYRYLRRHNKKVVLGAFGMDYYWTNTCIKDKPLRYSDFNIDSELRTNKEALEYRDDWIGTVKGNLNHMIAKDADGIVACLYEYWACYSPSFPNKTSFIPLPIEIPEPHPIETADKLRLFIGINKSRNAYKGTDIMLQAAKDIALKYPAKVELRIAESMPFVQYQEMMDGSDAILDQLYSYTPSMNSLLAMSKGIIDIGGGEPESYEILGEKDLRPIVNVQPNYESVFSKIESLVLNPDLVKKLKEESCQYVARHHNYVKVAKQYERTYQSIH